MELSYPLRLACLIAVSMGVLQTAFELALWCCAPFLLRCITRLTLRHQERALFASQLLPLALSAGITACFWVPQYISRETNFASEAVGSVCMIVTAALFAWWAIRATQGTSLAVRTMQFSRECRRAGNGISVRPGNTPIFAVSGSLPRAGLVGLLRPFIFISKSLIEDGGLDPLALSVVLDHERSHAVQRDNCKLLLLHCLPCLNLRLPSGKTWTQLWQNTAELAADEDAVAGDRTRALILAETLVALARSSSAAPRHHVACAFFLFDQTELALRVDRLIATTPSVQNASGLRVGASCGLALVSAGVVMANAATALRDIPERLLHLG